MSEVLRRQRLLTRAGFGARPGEVLARDGAEAWIRSQLSLESSQDRALSARLAAFPLLRDSRPALLSGLGVDEEAMDAALDGRPAGAGARLDEEQRRAVRDRSRETARHVAGARIVKSLYGADPLRRVMVDFWSNHFSVDARTSFVGGLLPQYERDVLERHALGRFADLLTAVARSPAMLVYLDNWRSTAPRDVRLDGSTRRGRRRLERLAQLPGKVAARRRGGINENYARELLELHTLGVSGGYTQADVIQVARVFTGWSLSTRSPRSPLSQGGGIGFAFRDRVHDGGAKWVLGERVAGSGVESGEWLLRRLARHPSTAEHVAGKLVRRFVADDPPPALVARAARRFLETDGEIREVLRTILLSAEFADPDQRKLKTPLRFTLSALRETGGDTDGGRALLLAQSRLGELPYYAGTPAGFPETAVRWVDPGSMLERMNLAFALARGWVRGTRLGSAWEATGTANPALRSLSSTERTAALIAAPKFQWT